MLQFEDRINWNWDTLIKCPECALAACHPVSLRVNAGGKITIIDDREKPAFHEGRPYGRGVSIVITYDCEFGHRFYQGLHFHKGMTIIGESAPESIDEPSFGAIWRD